VVSRDRSNLSITLTQPAYVIKILEKFHISIPEKPSRYPMHTDYLSTQSSDSSPLLPEDLQKVFQQEVGCLMYLMTQTRIDLHFSDTWADPSNQTMPLGWSSEIDKLEKEVYEYTQQTLQTFVLSGVTPQWIQIGNEVAGGFLWPVGKITSGDASQWQNFVRLQNASTRALRAVLPKALSIVHLECGGDHQRVQWWLNNAQTYGLVNYDVLGLSYYSQWSGPLEELSKTLNVVTSEFKKPVVIAETAYPWISQQFGNDVLDTNKALLDGHPFTANGQKKFVLSLEKILRQQPGNRGVGLWWWEPMALKVLDSSGVIIWNGGMANSALFDIQGRVLPALNALNGE
jgi:arabinogalactan endo-1,4-beta-galactosidase